jgi:hypothetical protein
VYIESTVENDGPTNDDLPEAWFVTEMSYDGGCLVTDLDPCNQYPDDFAQIVFDRHSKVNDPTGFCVIIGQGAHFPLTDKIL